MSVCGHPGLGRDAPAWGLPIGGKHPLTRLPTLEHAPAIPFWVTKSIQSAFPFFLTLTPQQRFVPIHFRHLNKDKRDWHDLGEGRMMHHFSTGLKDAQIVGKILFLGVSVRLFPEEVGI